MVMAVVRIWQQIGARVVENAYENKTSVLKPKNNLYRHVNSLYRMAWLQWKSEVP